MAENASHENCPSCVRAASAMQSLKALDTLLLSVMADLWALRQAVLENPELRRVYERHLNDATVAARPVLADAMECYERIISGAEEPTRFEGRPSESI